MNRRIRNPYVERPFYGLNRHHQRSCHHRKSSLTGTNDGQHCSHHNDNTGLSGRNDGQHRSHHNDTTVSTGKKIIINVRIDTTPFS